MNKDSAPNYITPQGYSALTCEFEHLLKVERPKTTQIVQWAASLGDRSENADYIYGKKKLREIDRRIRFLTKRIESAKIIEPSKVKSNKVQFGASVKVLDEKSRERIFFIVGIDETNPSVGKISWCSPVAKALIGKEVGDDVVVKAPSGDIDFEILEIIYKDII